MGPRCYRIGQRLAPASPHDRGVGVHMEDPAGCRQSTAAANLAGQGACTSRSSAQLSATTLGSCEMRPSTATDTRTGAYEL